MTETAQWPSVPWQAPGAETEPEPPQPPQNRPSRINLTVTPVQYDRYAAAAITAGVTLPEWMRRACDLYSDAQAHAELRRMTDAETKTRRRRK